MQQTHSADAGSCWSAKNYKCEPSHTQTHSLQSSLYEKMQKASNQPLQFIVLNPPLLWWFYCVIPPKGRRPIKKNVFFRALPESGGGEAPSQYFWPF